MTYGELYKIGNTYECLEIWTTDKWNKCEIIDIAYTKTGRIKAKVKNCRNEVFFTTARKQDVVIGRTIWENLEYKKLMGVSEFRNLTIK